MSINQYNISDRSASHSKKFSISSANFQNEYMKMFQQSKVDNYKDISPKHANKLFLSSLRDTPEIKTDYPPFQNNVLTEACLKV